MQTATKAKWIAGQRRSGNLATPRVAAAQWLMRKKVSELQPFFHLEPAAARNRASACLLCCCNVPKTRECHSRPIEFPAGLHDSPGALFQGTPPSCPPARFRPAK